VGVHEAISQDIGTLLSVLRTRGVEVDAARYDEHSFGNFEVSLRSSTRRFRITRDRDQYMIHGPDKGELEAAGLWIAFDSKTAFSEAVLAWVGWSAA
jgi:hypothetical protein